MPATVLRFALKDRRESGAADGGEPAREVFLEVLDVFQAHRHADQFGRDALRAALLLGETAVRGRGRVHYGGLGIAEVRGDREQSRRVDEAPCRWLPAGDREREHAAEAALLAAGERVIGMRGESRVIHALSLIHI